jgi:hypothetical protein
MKLNKGKIIIPLILLMSLFALTACSSGLQEFAETTLPEAIKDRGEANRTMVGKLEAAGLISETTATNLKNNIDKQIATYTKTEADGTISDKMLSTVQGAVSKYHLGGEGSPSYITYIKDDGTSYNLTYDSDNDEYSNSTAGVSVSDSSMVDSTATVPMPLFIMSNYLHVMSFGQDGIMPDKDSDGKYTVTRTVSEPIQMISDANILDQNVDAKIYVLKTDITSVNGTNTIDGVIAAIESTKNMTDGAARQNILNEYFELAKDSTGKTISFVTEDLADGLISLSVDNDDITNTKTGYDLIIGQYDMEDCVHVRFYEINSDKYEEINKLLGTDTTEIYFVKGGDSGVNAYVMQYPIQVVDYFKYSDTDDNVEITFKDSGLGVNLWTGKFIKYQEATNGRTSANDNFDYTTGEDINIDEFYLTLNPSQENTSESLCSLIVQGNSKVGVSDADGTEYRVSCGRIILRDYLEATWAPGYESGDDGNVAVFGRKIRLKLDSVGTWTKDGDSYKYKVKRSEQIGEFIDKSGNRLDNSPTLQVTDFIDAKAILKDDAYVKRLPAQGESTGTIKAQVTTIESGTPITKLETMITENIEVSVMFPSSSLGKADYKADTTSKQRFYCLVTTKGLFDSALFSSWIESSSTTASLDWWNSYLSDNGFLYNVDHNNVNNYLKGSYSYEMSQSGIVVLDLNTVAKIQKMFDKINGTKTTRFVRTTFMIIGYLLIVMAMILMLLWVIDTNSDIGVKLLEKVTFGRWVAVKYESDIPSHNANGQTYLSGGKMFFKCLIIMSIGLMLVFVNIFDIITALIKVFGKFGGVVQKLIKGIRG